MVGAIGSYFDFGSVSEGISEPRGAGEEICSVGVQVCEKVSSLTSWSTQVLK